ncbi:MAG: alanine:cation symporter family protein, partial [Moraxellaceae bacterium]|nr:alanine:cation symporter family protein [Moraxellaceae bacterium]
GGVTGIAKVTDKVVPFMAILYVTMSLFVILGNLEHLGDAFSAIISGAFTGEGVVGGFIGALIQGLKRAVFSNEAGIGSAAIAHSAVKTDEPATEGLVALLEPFIDTVIICTMTALVISISGLNTPENIALAGGEGALTGVDLTKAAFVQTSTMFEIPLTIAIILFAISTMLSWSYYGLKAWTYLFGEHPAIANLYKAIFCIFIVVGASIQFHFVLDFSDAAIFAMSIFNIIGLYLLMPVVKKEINSFVARVKSGEIKKFK